MSNKCGGFKVSGVATAIAGAAVIGSITNTQASKRSAKASKGANRSAQQFIEDASSQTREDANRLFTNASNDANKGYQGALDVFSQTIPQQVQAFQGGNVAAQQALLAGLPQQQNAIFGNPVQQLNINPYQYESDLSFANQQLPDYARPAAYDFSAAAQQYVPENALAGQPQATPLFGRPGSEPQGAPKKAPWEYR